MTSNRARWIAGALAILLGVLYVGLVSAELLPLDQRIENLRAAIAERNQRLDVYMNIQAMKCEKGELTLNIDASASAGEAVYDYNDVTGCRYLPVPEPSISLMLALGCLWMAGRGRGSCP